MKKKVKHRKKFYYIQDWGTYSVETPIIVGYTPKEITKLVKNSKWKDEVKSLWSESDFDHLLEKGCALTLRDKGYTIVILESFQNNWSFYETLMHECFHLVVYVLGEERAFVNSSTDTIEDEGMAYQLEYLFRGIRTNLQKAFANPKK